MRELTYLGRCRIEWRSVAEPALQGELLVRGESSRGLLRRREADRKGY
jgi:hypothetical protein